jgi:hypothetical protein
MNFAKISAHADVAVNAAAWRRSNGNGERDLDPER